METRNLFNELISLLAQEIEIHKQMIVTSKELNRCAREKQLETLQQQCGVYDELISGLERVEERRLEVCETLMSLTNGKAPSGKIISLAELSEPDQKKKLLSLKAELGKRINELTAANTANTVLFKEALGEIDASVGMLREAARPKTGYRQKGQVRRSKSELSVFNQVV